MNWPLSFIANEKLYLRNPQESDLGKNILREGMIMMYELGLEDFTFKKLAVKLNTNESSQYRYFENKNRLLQYYFEWYWKWLDYQVFVFTQNITNQTTNLDIILQIITSQKKMENSLDYWNKDNLLRNLYIKEGDKAYLTHQVLQDNQLRLFKTYKDLCYKISVIISQIDPSFPYPRSLTSTIMEMAHHQIYFMNNLPSLTDFAQNKDEKEVYNFLKELCSRSLRIEI